MLPVHLFELFDPKMAGLKGQAKVINHGLKNSISEYDDLFTVSE